MAVFATVFKQVGHSTAKLIFYWCLDESQFCHEKQIYFGKIRASGQPTNTSYQVHQYFKISFFMQIAALLTICVCICLANGKNSPCKIRVKLTIGLCQAQTGYNISKGRKTGIMLILIATISSKNRYF
jgi:hypothetical protein